MIGTSVLTCVSVFGITQARRNEDKDFGPVVRAYLGYLRNEQEVVDDRISRREISATYYRRNSNRIRALRQMAIQIARQSRNDYLPELEAVARDELGLLFEQPPRPETLHNGEVLHHTFRFLGSVRAGEIFYLFARLDPYEQSELLENSSKNTSKSDSRPVPNQSGVKAITRSRPVPPP